MTQKSSNTGTGVTVIPVRQLRIVRLTGESKHLVSQAVKHGPLGQTMVGPPTARRINLAHPVTLSWLQERGVDLAKVEELVGHRPKASTGRKKKASKKATKKKASSSDQEVGSPPPDDPEDYLDLSLREVTERWGSFDQFKDHVDARRKIADTRRLELKNASLDGSLIPRDLVRVHCFGVIDAAHRRLLGDTALTIARRIVTSNVSVEEAQRITRDLITSQLKPLKASVSKAIRTPTQHGENLDYDRAEGMASRAD